MQRPPDASPRSQNRMGRTIAEPTHMIRGIDISGAWGRMHTLSRMGHSGFTGGPPPSPRA